MRLRPAFLTLSLCVGGAVTMIGVQETSVAEDRITDAEHCINIRRIESTEVVDDERIPFYMMGDDVYLNELSNACPALEFEDTFMYRTVLSRLCDMDIITVLHDAAFGFQPGASCGLGMFRPVTEEMADQLARAADDD